MGDVRGFQFGEFTPISNCDLPKGITRQALIELRNNGMSNKAIAESIGIAPWKVEKSIGRTPKEIRTKILSKSLEKARQAHKEMRESGRVLSAKKPDKKVEGLQRSYEAVRLSGKLAVYRLNHEKRVLVVSMRDDIGEETHEGFACGYAQIEPFIEELLAVTSEIDKLLKE